MNKLRRFSSRGFLENEGRFWSKPLKEAPLKKVLILKKRTRYELEKLSQVKPLSDDDFNDCIRKRGPHAEGLIHSYKLHQKLSIQLKLAFLNAGFQVEVINRPQFNQDAINWADLIVTAGGDGTFLMGASEITGRSKPLVGFNTNPHKSMGYLCLPHCITYETAARRIKQMEFQWKYRTRIEVKLTGHVVDNPEMIGGVEKKLESPPPVDKCGPVTSRILPSKALNEIFVAEKRPSQVTNLILDVPGVPKTHVKCSGVCVSTGTGSTSWHMSMNRISLAKVHRLFKIAKIELTPDKLVEITTKCNESLQFPFDDPRMFYTVRDLIYSPITPEPSGIPSEAFTPSMTLVSKCVSATIVMDGTRAWNFDDGTIAELTTKPEIALRTIHFPL